MNPFTALDEVLNSRALTPAPAREIALGAGDFQPLFTAGALGSRVKGEEKSEGHESPEIELVEVEGRVQQIIVTCRCGERTVLDCAY